MTQPLAHNTYLADESAAYPNGGQTRPGRAIFPDGATRRVWAGIPDTLFSIPAHARIGSRYVGGYVTVDDGLIACPHLPHQGDTLHCESCQFGLMDSPTRGALLFHPHKRYTEQETA